MMDDEPPKATVPEPVSNINEVPESVIPAKWYLHPKVYQPPRYIRPLPKRQSTSRRGSRRSGSRSGRSSRSSSISSLSYAPPPGYEPTNEESWFSKKKTRSSSIRSDGPVKPLVSVEEWVSPRRSSRKKTKKENSTSTLPVPKPPRRPSATKVVAEEPIAKVPSKKEPKTPHEDGGEDKQEVSVERSRSQYMGIAKHLTLPLFESVSMEGEEEVDDSGDSVQMEDDLTVYEEYAGHGEEDGGSDGDSPYETPFRLNPHQAGPVGTLIIAPRALSRSVSKYSKKSDKSKIDHRAHTPLSSNSSSRSSDAAVKDITDQEEDWSKVALPSLPPVPSSPSASLKRDGPANVKADSPPKNAPLGARRGSLSDLPPVCKPQRLAPLNVTSPVEKPSPAVTSPVVSNHGEEKNTVRPVMSFPQLRPRTFSLTQYEEGKRQLDRRFSTDMTTSVPCLPSSSEGSPQKEHHGALTPNGSTRPPLARRALHEGKSPTSGENSVKEEGFHMMEKVE
ncbi:serine/arginine repetitive matrix protein 1 [Angomonas deanei]|nr:serine/arginine repetitive matrix protein 1 [Angomonas deanei]|eukprot:EPY22314.1 serine/arginine repetitive matrix protein 1 [Angomonas deanei]